MISHGVFENIESCRLMIYTTSKHTDHKTSLKYLLIVSPEC